MKLPPYPAAEPASAARISCFLLFIFFITCLPSAAQDGGSSVEKQHKWLLSGGIGYMMLVPEKGDNMNFIGVDITLGYRILPRHFISVDFAYVSYSGKKIGEFSYTKTYTSGKSETFYDGVIKRAYEAVPFTLNWTYEIPISEKWRLQVGPSVGFIDLSATDSYSPKVDGTPSKNTENNTVFTFGGKAAAEVQITPRGALNLRYRYLSNGKVTFGTTTYKSTSHQVAFSYVWRFGRR